MRGPEAGQAPVEGRVGGRLGAAGQGGSGGSSRSSASITSRPSDSGPGHVEAGLIQRPAVVLHLDSADGPATPRASLPMSRTTRPPEQIQPHCGGRPQERASSALEYRAERVVGHRSNHNGADLGRGTCRRTQSPFEQRDPTLGATHAARALSHGSAQSALARTAALSTPPSSVPSSAISRLEAIVLEFQPDLNSTGRQRAARIVSASVSTRTTTAMVSGETSMAGPEVCRKSGSSHPRRSQISSTAAWTPPRGIGNQQVLEPGADHAVRGSVPARSPPHSAPQVPRGAATQAAPARASRARGPVPDRRGSSNASRRRSHSIALP